MSSILVVDDEKKIRNIYRDLLTHEGYRVIEAEDGEAATMALLANPDIDLVLLDLCMPVVDGPAFYDVLRLFNPSIKVIVTSAYSLEDQKSLVREADEYYEKSQDTDSLLQKVRKVLRGVSSTVNLTL